jgi:DNA-binding HxlR family transcriptional regulator
MSTQVAGMARPPHPHEPSRRAREATPARTLPEPKPPHVPARDAAHRPTTPLELALEALGGPYRPLVVWALFWGARPFSELMRHVPHVTKKALRRELAELSRLGLVARDVRTGPDRRAEYSLSPLGQTLRPVVGALYEWGLLRIRFDRVWRVAETGAEPGASRPPSPVLPDLVRPDEGRSSPGKENSR